MAVLPLILTNGTVADADEVMSLFYEIYSNIDDSNVAVGADIQWVKMEDLPTGQMLVGNGANKAEPTVVAFPSANSIAPIGSIIAFYDFNGALTFPGANWAYCDGAVANFTGIGAQTTPDLSGRYLVGFGTDGGGDIDTAPWATAAVGNAGSVINFQHAHTVDAHTHDVGTLSFNVPAHYHGTGTLQIAAGGSHAHNVYEGIAGGGNTSFNAATDTSNVATVDTTAVTHAHPNGDFSGSVGNTGGSDGDAAFASVGGGGSTGAASSSSMNNQLSAAQDIRPSSIRVRFIIRIT